MCAHSSSSSSRNPFDSFWLPLIYALISHLERGAIVCARPSCWAEWRHDRRERKKPVALGPKHKWISRVIKDARLLFSCNYIVGYRFYIHTYHLIPIISPVNPSLSIFLSILDFIFTNSTNCSTCRRRCAGLRESRLRAWAPLYVSTLLCRMDEPQQQ